MLLYPLISIVLTANRSLPQIEPCLRALNRLDYPKDQIEFFLIIPAERQLPDLPKLTPRLRVIRFDATLGWNPQNARIEGITLANGEFIQFLDGAFLLKSDWLRKAVNFFDHNQVFGISGEIFGGDCPSDQSVSEDDGAINFSSLMIADGLYDRRKLKELVVDEDEFEIFAVSQPPLPEEVTSLATRMAEATPARRSPGTGANPHFSNNMQRLLTRYMFTRNKE